MRSVSPAGTNIEIFSKSDRSKPPKLPPSTRVGGGSDYHQPVMPDEVVHFLAPARGKLFLDGTLGGGGHASRVLEEGANVIGIDQDTEALQFARKRLASHSESFCAVHANFSEFDELLETVGITSGLDGILLDLGVSSRQLDEPSRGFSFNHDGPLDMRMNPEAELNAAELVNNLAEVELARIIYEYGEERASRRIAAAIVSARSEGWIGTTHKLAEIVESVRPRRGRQHPATKVFQALRIAVNDELGNLERALELTHRWLKPGGRLVVITFHSLEDRIVKRFLRSRSQEWLDRPEYPEPIKNPDCVYDLVLKKPLAPSEDEVSENPRARSAKMRIAERREVSEKATK